MAIYSIIACCEEHGSPVEPWAPEGSSPSVFLRCTWALRHALVADLLGNRRVWPYGLGADPPVATTAVIRTDMSQGIVSGQSISYVNAVVEVGYSSSNEEYSESLEPTAEFITLDYKRFRWGADDGDPIQEGEAPGRLVRTFNLVRSASRVVAVPITALTLPGAVNDAVYVSALLGLTFPAETLLFQPPQLSRTLTVGGDNAWNMTTKFTYKAEGWNTYWRASADPPAYERMYLVDGGGAPYNGYPLEDFSDWLF